MWANNERTSTFGWTIPAKYSGEQETRRGETYGWKGMKYCFSSSHSAFPLMMSLISITANKHRYIYIYQLCVSMMNADQMSRFTLIFTSHTKRPPQTRRPFLMMSVFQIHTAHAHNLADQIDLLSVQVFIPQILDREKEESLSISRTSKNLCSH